jgi:YHS domain-containing protein
MAVDPICRMEVDEKTVLSVEHDGKKCYFCSPGWGLRLIKQATTI